MGHNTVIKYQIEDSIISTLWEENFTWDIKVVRLYSSAQRRTDYQVRFDYSYQSSTLHSKVENEMNEKMKRHYPCF